MLDEIYSAEGHGQAIRDWLSVGPVRSGAGLAACVHCGATFLYARIEDGRRFAFEPSDTASGKSSAASQSRRFPASSQSTTVNGSDDRSRLVGQLRSLIEPSRQTVGRRRRAQLALARRLDDELGADAARIVHDFGDGWSVRVLDRREDQLREGELMHSCLRTIRDGAPLDPNCYSLRDAENLPHLSFAVWSVNRHDDLDEVPREPLGVDFGQPMQFLLGERVLLVDLAGRSLRAEHRERLLAFAGSDYAAATERFPCGTRERLRIIAPALAPAVDHELLFRVIDGDPTATAIGRLALATVHLRNVDSQ